MNDFRESTPNLWMGLAVVAGSDRSVCDELRTVLPAGARVVLVTDEHEYRDVLTSVIRGGESGIVGHADPDRAGDLIVLVAPLKELGSIRNVILLGEPPSIAAASVAMRSGITWLDSCSARIAINGPQTHDDALASCGATRSLPRNA